MKFQSHYSYKQKPSHIEKVKGESQTIQGESKTIKELLARLQAGQELDRKEVMYMDTEDIDNINSMYKRPQDFTDLDALREHNQKISYELGEIAKAKQEEAKIKKAEASRKKEILEPKDEEDAESN